jgi:hypothetical protein
MQVLQRLIRFARKPLANNWRGVRYRLEEMDWYWKIHKSGNDRTTYVIGLFGTGRLYINELMLQNIGERAKYFRKHTDPPPSRSNVFYLQPPCHNQVCFSLAGVARGNKPYIGSGQIQICRFDFYLSSSPRFLAVKLGLVADISSQHHSRFCYLGPLYKNTDDLCDDLEQNFLEFKAFAEGDPDFY